MTAPAPQQPSPVLFFETVNAYQRTAAIRAAVELRLFTAIGKGHNTPATLAQACQAAERGVRILCDFLTVIGFLTKSGGSYALTTDTATFLDERSPAYMGSALRFLLSPYLTEGFKDLAPAVRKGGTVVSEQGSLAPSHPMWIEFARAMAPMMSMSADLLAQLLRANEGKPCKVLDIAAGHGLFGIAFARHNPNAQVTALDWPVVLEVAEENARAAGVAERHRLLPGSAFDVDYGAGYDVALLTNFLHHFDMPTCEKLLRKVHAALGPGGRAVTLEFVPNEDRVTPPAAATFSMIMLGSTPAGDAYTFVEYQSMFRNAGFSRSELHPLPPTFQSAVISHK
jgi:ubiquinone/menaquinone biosynthesis C-methylase UbiE